MTAGRVTRSVRTGNASTTISTASLVEGDHVFLMIQWGDVVNTLVAPGTGWDVVLPKTSMGTRSAMLLHKKYTSADGASYTITLSAATSITISLCAFYEAKEYSDFIIGASKLRNSITENDNTNIAPAVVMPAAGVVCVFSFEATAAQDTVSPTVSPGTFWHWSASTIGDTQTEQNVLAYQNTAVGATMGPYTITYQNTQASNGLAIAVGIPTYVPPEDHSGALLVGWKDSIGHITQGRLVAKMGAGSFVDVQGFVRIPTGYSSVADMMRQGLFEIAHRGGSASFPEMSLHAYTQSVILGYKALEISLARTSDGVWFGLHDNTLDRTSGVTGVTASALTWAQVQTYNITLGPGGPQPYMRLEQLLDAYGRTHVLFMDPKAALSQRTSLLNLLQTYYGSDAEAAKHVVAKYYGIEGNTAGTTGWAADARARGYKTWGYFYEAEVVSGDLATYQGRWDILGMAYGAPGSSWTAVNSYGKPVIAHILPNAAAKTAAMAYSPEGLMVSGTTLITPSAKTTA